VEETPVNKSHLVAYIARELQTSRLQAARLVDTVLTGIRLGLQEDTTVKLSGFGTFEVKRHKARIGRNPKSGERIKIPASTRVAFRVGKQLRSRLAIGGEAQSQEDEELPDRVTGE